MKNLKTVSTLACSLLVALSLLLTLFSCSGKDKNTDVVATTTDSLAPFTLTFNNTRTVTIPIHPQFRGQYNYKVDSNGDDVFEGPFTSNATFKFQTQGPHTISIKGTFPAIQFGSSSGAAMADKVSSLDRWGGIQWRSMKQAFKGCTNMETPATDIPNTSKVTDMSGMFEGATKANPAVGDWDVSNVTNMSSMFKNSGFDQQIRWKTLNNGVTMANMFDSCKMSAANFTTTLYVFGSSDVEKVVLGADQMQLSDYSVTIPLFGTLDSHTTYILTRLINELEWNIQGKVGGDDSRDTSKRVTEDLGTLGKEGIVDMDKFKL